MEGRINLQPALAGCHLRGLRHQVRLRPSRARQNCGRHQPATPAEDFHRELIHNDRLKTVEEEVLAKAYDSRLMRRLLGYLRPYAVYIAVSLLFLIVYSALQVCGPLLT